MRHCTLLSKTSMNTMSYMYDNNIMFEWSAQVTLWSSKSIFQGFQAAWPPEIFHTLNVELEDTRLKRMLRT